ncbi:MAG TPA: hypothetical protein VJH75_00650 [Patescibacteria group bacterium]|nr:hypothetical protein [Patescibacteria group bacterium]
MAGEKSPAGIPRVETNPQMLLVQIITGQITPEIIDKLAKAELVTLDHGLQKLDTGKMNERQKDAVMAVREALDKKIEVNKNPEPTRELADTKEELKKRITEKIATLGIEIKKGMGGIYTRYADYDKYVEKLRLLENELLALVDDIENIPDPKEFRSSALVSFKSWVLPGITAEVNLQDRLTKFVGEIIDLIIAKF